MIFNSAAFAVFIIVLWPSYWLVRNRSWRHGLLLVASFVFYGWWDWRFLPLLWTVIAVAYLAGIGLERHRRSNDDRVRWILVISLVIVLGFLAYFKYAAFIVTILDSIDAVLGFGGRPVPTDIILPVGISFFTFQAMSYIVDVYRGNLPAERNPAKLALYIAFFPQLVAGPIVRATDFLPQLDTAKVFSSVAFLRGIRLFLIGFIYKIVFADNLAPFVDTVFGSVPDYDNGTLFAGLLGFYGQIYFDFAGYSLMAIGVAATLGYWIPENFNFPYRSLSVTEFWRRWHISLSQWLRDYLFIPLGGNRGGSLRYARNIMITMLLGGLWHGASWNFVVWGGLHGVALIVQKAWSERSAGRMGTPGPVGAIPAWLMTQGFVLLAWIPFRAATTSDSMAIFSGIFGFRDDAGLEHEWIPWALLILPLLIDTFIVGGRRTDRLAIRNSTAAYAVYALAFFVALWLAFTGINSFIYFQF